ncbi:hypothetical protein Q3G72_005434 [Acer saccharum]|nr:hypothetical protein Q3G72_005434 [Acer saccharum]
MWLLGAPTFHISQTFSLISTCPPYQPHITKLLIDALAKSRDGRYRIVSNDERVQTLNQLLTERQERHRSCLLGDGTDDLDAVKWELYWTTLRR